MKICRPPSHPSKPAQTFRRTWNNNWAFEHSPLILFPPGDQTGAVNQDGNQTGLAARDRPDSHGHHNIQMH